MINSQEEKNTREEAVISRCVSLQMGMDGVVRGTISFL